MPTVYILGAGMGGLAAAHELVERGYHVIMYERQPAPGGKARSDRFPNTGGGDPARNLPNEHGFRFFPGFYFHIMDTMSRIPRAGGSHVIDSLVHPPECVLAFSGQPPFVLPAHVPAPGDLPGWIKALHDLVLEQLPEQVPDSEKLFFLRQLFCFLVSGKNRRELVYDNIAWWDYIDAPNKSQGYRDILAKGLTRSLVAMQPEVGSTLTVGTILVQILLNMFDSHAFADSVLDGPTSDVWITPWVAYLQAQGGANFELFCGHTVDGFVFDPVAKRITGVKVTDSATGTQTTVGSAADHYIAALPVDIMQALLAADTQGIKAAAGLGQIDQLKVSWMNGVLFYVDHNAGERHGHVIYVNSSWALTSIEQQQFWNTDIGTTYGAPGPAKDIVSAIISDWKSPGQFTTGSTAQQCTTPDQVLNEAWAQLKDHRSTWTAGSGRLVDADKVNQWLDTAITMPGGVSANSEPLLVNVVGTHAARPDASTAIANLFLASDYVKTYTDLATMEAANEAGRRAAIGVLTRDNPTTTNLPVIRPLHEPEVFRALQHLDDIAFEPFRTHPADAPPPLLCTLMHSLDDVDFRNFAQSGGTVVPASAASILFPPPPAGAVGPPPPGTTVPPTPPSSGGAGTATTNWLVWVLVASNLVLLALLIYVLLAG